jgi:hypothetical protein
MVVNIRVDLVQALGVEAAGPAFDAVHFIALPQQEFGQVRSVLARDAGN